MSNLKHLQQLAQVAALHAKDQGVQATLQPAVVDQLLDRLREQQPIDFDAIVPCYGAWFGETCIRQFSGHWLALDEPVPPRIQIAGGVFSPMDAIHRRLTRPNAARLVDLFEELATWAETSANRDWHSENLQAWTTLVESGRFVNHLVPTDRQTAEASLDAWLIQEGLVDKNVLCLAAGGATHGPLLAMAGAQVTVVDTCDAALQYDRQLADRAGLQDRVRTQLASMDDLSALPPASFDIVVHPVSLCYAPSTIAVYDEVARVLVPGGLYVSQQKSPASLQSAQCVNTASHPVDGYIVPFQRTNHPLDPVPDSSRSELAQQQNAHREPGTHEYVHSLASLIGHLCRAGFVVEDLSEPCRSDLWATPNSPEHRAAFFPPYLKIKARRRSGPESN